MKVNELNILTDDEIIGKVVIARLGRYIVREDGGGNQKTMKVYATEEEAIEKFKEIKEKIKGKTQYIEI